MIYVLAIHWIKLSKEKIQKREDLKSYYIPFGPVDQPGRSSDSQLTKRLQTFQQKFRRLRIQIPSGPPFILFFLSQLHV